MKKLKCSLIFMIFIIIMIAVIPSKVNAAIYADTGYNIQKYDIDMIVNENNTFDITETITVYFNELRHGIYRKIPLRNSVVRLDGTETNNRAQITNISVSEKYSIHNENGYKVIKIGDANNTLKGSHTYKIKYTYNIGKDPIKNADELYFNLIGDQWDTYINTVSFKITMPKVFDETLLGFSSGNVGSTDSSNVNYSVIGNTIQGTLNSRLSPGQAFTVRLTLPDEYFVNAGLKIDPFNIFVIIICLAFVLVSYLLWKKFGKDDQVVETVEFYPPEGYNSAEIGFLYKGIATDEDVVSLLIYLANKGYIKIEETEEKTLFLKSKGFKLIKLKEYDGNNECERIFFNGLFRTKNVVTYDDLYNRFYITVNKIKSKLNSKVNKNKVFEPLANGKRKWLIIMMVIIYLLITIKPILEYSPLGIAILPFALMFPMVGYFLIITPLFSNSKTIYVNGVPSKFSIVSKILIIIFGLIWGGMFAFVPWTMLVLPCLLQDIYYLIIYIIGIACIIAITIFKSIMPKRTPYGTEILGKLKGFKRFLETAEKPELESLVAQNPEYFYNILPYTYVLGVSDTWIKQFETIAIQPPTWYGSYGAFDMYTFRTFLNTTMASASSAMSSSPSSSGGSSGGFSGGGSSGGGSSGGGSGGGGRRVLVKIKCMHLIKIAYTYFFT